MPVILAPPETPLIIDTVILTHLINGHPYVQKAINAYLSNTKKFPAISSMTIFEANFGIEKNLALNKITIEKAKDHRQKIKDFVRGLERVLSFDQRAAEIAAYVYPRIPKKELRKQKDKEKKIWQDLFIIATAISHNYGLATQNEKDAELIANHLPDDMDLRLAVWKP